MKSELIDINLCEASPLLSHVPLEVDVIRNLEADRDYRDEAAVLKDQWAAWSADVAHRGVDDPGKFYREKGKCWFVDARNRLHAAKLAGHPAFPGIEIKKADAYQIALASLAHRKAATKGGLAYLALTFYPNLAEAGPGRKKESPGDQGINSLPALASQLGVSDGTMEEAKATFVFFRDHPEQRAKMEPRVIAGVIGLGAARAGAAAAEKTGGTARKPVGIGQYRLTLTTLENNFKAAAKWGEATKAEAVKATAEMLTKCPAARELFTAALAAADAAPEADAT